LLSRDRDDNPLHDIVLEDVNIVHTIGLGGFGRVELVRTSFIEHTVSTCTCMDEDVTRVACYNHTRSFVWQSLPEVSKMTLMRISLKFAVVRLI